jgi:hypothetical protein
MKKILIFQWFHCNDALRKDELVQCIEHNLELGFDNVIIFNDSVKPTFTGDNITNIEAGGRLTYHNFIDVMNEPRNFGAMVCLTNTDIKLDKRIFELSPMLDSNVLFSISRHEHDGQLTDLPWCSQDTWVALSQPVPQSVQLQSAIPLGMPGCENRIAEVFFSAGFRVFNPCLGIKNVHVHSEKSALRDENRLFGAYLFVPACGIGDIGKRESFPTPVYLPRYAKQVYKIGG